MTSPTDQTYLATFGTILFSLLGIQDISDFANIVFMSASTISCAISILIGIKQLKKKK